MEDQDHHILIISANAGISKKLEACAKEFLPIANFFTATSGQSCINFLRAQNLNYHCVFLDCNLPDFSGLEVLKTVYDHDLSMTPFPFVMIGGEHDKDQISALLQYGAEDYLSARHISRESVLAAMTKARISHDMRKARHVGKERLLQIQKMEAVGQLASGLAHDFNNLLSVILGNTGQLLCQSAAIDDDNTRRKIKTIENTARRGVELVKRMMLVARQGRYNPVITDVNTLIEANIDMYEITLDDHIKIKSIYEENLWPVVIDQNDLEHALLNLVVNARDAMPGGGILGIETLNTEVDEAYHLLSPEIEPGAYVQITVSDTGTGMTRETAGKIFEPFFTTKSAQDGTGLGLSMVYGFVRKAGGSVHVYSEPGQGSVFRIYLPVDKDAAGQKPLAQPHELSGNNETVLVADDDELVRTVAAEMLGRLGYRAVTARNVPEALDVIESQSIDLLLVDLFMEDGMDGAICASKAKEIFPRMPVLFMTGYREHFIRDTLPDGELIHKPFNRLELARRIRQMLG